MWEIAGLALLVILIVILIFYYQRPEYLEGFWIGDEDFCSESECDSMLLYFGEQKNGQRPGYLVITDSIANQGFNITVGRNKSFDLYGFSYDGVITFDDEQIWDKDIQISINMKTGTMIVKSDKKVYGVLKKDLNPPN